MLCYVALRGALPNGVRSAVLKLCCAVLFAGPGTMVSDVCKSKSYRQCTGDIKRHSKHMHVQCATNDADRNGVVPMFLRPTNVYAIPGVSHTVATAKVRNRFVHKRKHV